MARKSYIEYRAVNDPIPFRIYAEPEESLEDLLKKAIALLPKVSQKDPVWVIWCGKTWATFWGMA